MENLYAEQQSGWRNKQHDHNHSDTGIFRPNPVYDPFIKLRNVETPMNMVNPSPQVKREHQTEIRVRYQETDAQGRVHHANYINYFEIGRVEMLRTSGISYRQFEELGLMLVVVAVECEFFHPARYDDLLTLKTSVIRAKGVRILHGYQIFLVDELVASGQTTVACVNRVGKVTRLPNWLQLD